MATIMREIVKIDEDKCDGCGLCVPNCAEGAIRIIDGKAKLVGENLCDGLGACLGHCPKDAITIEQRPAEEFDEAAVEQRLAKQKQQDEGESGGGCGGGCPGTMLRMLKNLDGGDTPDNAGDIATEPMAEGQNRPSRLGQWPVQLKLVPSTGPIWEDADVLIAADCVAYAMADFHEKLLAGRTLAIACPKLDDVNAYVAKLINILASNNIRSVTVAHMEVPCCNGIVSAVRAGIEASGRNDIQVRDLTVGIDGKVQAEQEMQVA
jgi:ferredoxin